MLEAVRPLDEAFHYAVETYRESSSVDIVQFDIGDLDSEVGEAYSALAVWYSGAAKSAARFANAPELGCALLYGEPAMRQQKIWAVAHSSGAKQFLSHGRPSWLERASQPCMKA